jgi:myo-inositol-1(or 4)-monophosphatase
MTALERRFETALALAAAAGALAMRMRPVRGIGAGISMKGAQDWLTEADGAVERFLSERLAAAFPDDGFQGEEGGRAREGRLRWVVDPIDGTSNYAHGGARFCVSLALVEDRTPVLGVLVAPALGETFAARAGHGATLNQQPIQAAATDDLATAIVEVGWNMRRTDADFLGLLGRIRAAGAAPRIGGSGAMGMAGVAAGRLDAYVELHIHLWDCAAAIVICQEAGAVVSPFMAGDGPVNGGPILAAAPGVAAAMAGIGDF